MCGFGIDTSVASYEEVTNAINNQGNKSPKKQPTPRENLITKLHEKGIDVNEYAKQHNLTSKTTAAEFTKLLEELEG